MALDNYCPPYVANFIEKIANDERFVNYSISNESGSNVGDGFMSTILSFTITGTRNGQPNQLSLMCKIPSSNITRRKEFQSDVAFERELYFYENVFPYFVKFQNDRGVHDDDDDYGFFAFPKCYGTVRDEKQFGDHTIVMENLKAQGYTMWDKGNDIDFDHCRLALAELGKLHAISFAIRDQDPDRLKEFMKINSELHETVGQTKAGQALQRSHFDRAIRSLEPSEVTLIGRMTELKDTYLDLLKEVKSKEACEPFGVLLHGDCWINNLMYLHAERPGRPSKVCLIDWQLSEFGSPALDLATFLFCSVTPKLRNDHFDEFINIYFSNFERTLSKLGSDPKKLFTFDDLQGQLKRFSKNVMFLGPIMIAIMTTDPSKFPDVDALVAKMNQINEGVADVHFNEFYNEDEPYKSRMSDMIRDMVRLGYW